VGKSGKIEITSMALHIMAMVFMLCDHLWGTVVPGNDWLTCIGRLAFPIFAFLLVEGYYHTRDLKKYAIRLLIFALLSEIPFNLAIGGSLLYPIHQNVLWSLLISLALIHWNEKVKEKKKIWMRFAVGIASVILGCIAGLVTFADYYHAGILTALVFYFFRQRKWWCLVGQLFCLWYINMEMLGGQEYVFRFLEKTWSFPWQGFALLALIPIWLYRGKQGYHSKILQYTYYAFYPMHLLILGVIRIL